MLVRRDIDPQTRDYTLTLGAYDKDASVTSKVSSRLSTRRGSIVLLPGYGSLLFTIKGPVPGWEQLAIRYSKQALDDLVRSREVNNLSVLPQLGSDDRGTFFNLIVAFTDRQGRPQRVTFTHRLTGA